MGGRGAGHIEHTQMGVFDVFEGGRKVGEAPSTTTCPSGLVVVFGRWGVAGVCSMCSRWDVGWEGGWAGV